MRLPDPALLVITDRRQARMPIADIVEAAGAAGCRWFSVREKDLGPQEQVRLLPGPGGMSRAVSTYLIAALCT